MGGLSISRRGHFNEPRNVVIYLVRRFRHGTLKEIGEEFGAIKYSTVRSIVERVKRDLSKNRDLRKRVEQLNVALIKSQPKS